MKVAILGAGALGSCYGTQFFTAGCDTVLVARGKRYERLNRRGLVVNGTPYAIRREAAGNAAAFSTSANDLTNRTKTTATVSWANNNLGTGPQTTPDLSAIVGEIVAGGGWASGNALVVFVQGNSGSSLLRWGAADGSNPAAELSVTYTPPSSGPAVAVLAGHYRRLAGMSAAGA